MYEDAWYSYVPEAQTEVTNPSSSKHRRRESLLKQPNGTNQISDLPPPIVELYEQSPALKGPPEATIARRAKSYSDFYEVATGFLNKSTRTEKSRDVLDVAQTNNEIKSSENSFEDFEDFEDDLLKSSHEEFQLYRDQLDLSERHLDGLLEDTTSALDLLAGLSESFKNVETQTTAFQAQCEDLLSEQKRIRDLADEIGVSLQYYAYLEPLTRRLNAPGSGRIVKNDDFLDMLMNLNTCIDFMDEHPNYRDSAVYKTRYISLLERSLNLVQLAFSGALREISDDVARQFKAKEQSETAEYVLLYGKYENVMSNLGSQVDRLLTTTEFAFGQEGDGKLSAPYIQQWHELYRQVLDSYFKTREPVGPLILKNLRKLAAKDPKPEIDFKSFARRCTQYVLDICHNEWSLIEKFFEGGPFFAEYPGLLHGDKQINYAERLEENRLSHLSTLHNFIAPYLNGGDLQRICDLTNWLETLYSNPNDSDMEAESIQGDRSSAVQALLSKYLWPLSDTLFLKAAKDIQYFKPSQEDLTLTKSTITGRRDSKNQAVSRVEIDQQIFDSHTPPVSNAFPTVKTAVRLLVMYNDGSYDRPRAGDVLYEIVHQATESLQKAATIIKRNSTIMDAQLFLIKNLMLIENLFMTHEIPDSIRQSAEFDFSPIWETIRELQERKQLFNPLAYFTPLVKGQLLPAVVDHLLDARKELEKVLVQQITAFTKYWQSRVSGKDPKKRDAVLKASKELEVLLDKVFDDETTRAALWKMIRADE